MPKRCCTSRGIYGMIHRNQIRPSHGVTTDLSRSFNVTRSLVTEEAPSKYRASTEEAPSKCRRSVESDPL